jgi:hypothetical protein
MVAGSNMVYGKRRSPYLFDKHSAHDVVDSQRQSAMKELEEFTETQILTTPTEDLVRYLSTNTSWKRHFSTRTASMLRLKK